MVLVFNASPNFFHHCEPVKSTCNQDKNKSGLQSRLQSKTYSWTTLIPLLRIRTIGNLGSFFLGNSQIWREIFEFVHFCIWKQLNFCGKFGLLSRKLTLLPGVVAEQKYMELKICVHCMLTTLMCSCLWTLLACVEHLQDFLFYPKENQLRRNCTSSQNWAYFVCYLKIISTVWKNNMN